MAVVTIRVLLADDQPLIRAGFRMFVDPDPEVEVVGEAGNGREAVALARTRARRRGAHGHPHAGHGRHRGHPADRRRRRPRRRAHARAHDLRERRQRRAGPARRGERLPRQSRRPGDLLHAIRVVAGRRGPALARGHPRPGLALPEPAGAGRRCPRRWSWAGSPNASARCSRWSRTGLSNDEIAERLHLSPLTVKTHINRAMTKLGVRDRAQLVVIAYQSGLVRPGEPQP